MMLLPLTMLVGTVTLIEALDIRSDRVTNWGSWGRWDECPTGSFVKAINIKVEPNVGAFTDDSALNAVRLSCVALEEQVTNRHFFYTKVLTSAEGQWGRFTGLEYCYKGVAVGFQLRSESDQGMGDDTAANDMKLICANRHGISKTSEKGQNWGSWRSEKRCPERTAVCGLRTQVEPNQFSDDDTALNNVDLRCCELPNPAKNCRPTDEWVMIFRRDNSKGRTSIKYKLREKVGVRRATDVSESSSVIENIAANVGFGGGITTPVLSALGLNFEAKLTTSSTTQHRWSRRETSVFHQEKEETTELEIPAQCDTTYQQLVGKCGSYVVNTNVMRRIDKCVNGTRIITMR